MKKEKIGKTFVILGIIIIIISGVIYIIKSNDNPNNNSMNNNEPEEKINMCIDDYKNNNLKKETAKINENTINMNVFSCMNAKKITDNKVKFYSKTDDSFYFEVYIIEDNIQNYSKQLDEQYTEKMFEENYNVAVTNDYITNSGKKYNVVNVYKKDDNEKINYMDYNMIGTLDNERIVHLRMVTNKYKFEDDVILLIEKSLEIK